MSVERYQIKGFLEKALLVLVQQSLCRQILEDGLRESIEFIYFRNLVKRKKSSARVNKMSKEY